MLTVTDMILRISTTYWRIVIAAVTGGVWSCIVELGIVQNVWFVSVGTYIVISFLMMRICVGRGRLLSLVKSVFVLYMVSAVLGGLLHLFYYMTKTGYVVRTVALGNGLLLGLLLVSVLLLAVLIRQFNAYRVYGAKVFQGVIVFGGKQVTVKALLDTGNVLMDPYYKKPVHIMERGLLFGGADASCMENAAEGNALAKKLHYVPFHSLGCSDGCLAVIMADSMSLSDGKNVRTWEHVLIGLYQQKLSSDGAYQMLLHGSLRF